MKKIRRGVGILGALNYYSKSYFGVDLNELLTSHPRYILELFKHMLKCSEDVALKLTAVLIRNYLLPNIKPRDLMLLINGIKQDNPHVIRKTLERYYVSPPKKKLAKIHR